MYIVGPLYVSSLIKKENKQTLSDTSGCDIGCLHIVLVLVVTSMVGWGCFCFWSKSASLAGIVSSHLPTNSIQLLIISALYVRLSSQMEEEKMIEHETISQQTHCNLRLGQENATTKKYEAILGTPLPSPITLRCHFSHSTWTSPMA